MSALTIIFTILQVLSGLAVTVMVLMQSGKIQVLFLDEKLAKATKWFALAFVLLTLVLNLI